MPHLEWRGESLRVRWDSGRLNPATGKKIWESKSSADWDEETAYNYGLDRESDIRNNRGVARADGRITFDGWADLWLKSRNLDPTTTWHYRKLLRIQLRPQWGPSPLVEITTIKYQAWEAKLSARYSPSYVKQITGLFSTMMGDAVTHRPKLIAESPVPPATRRRGRYVRPKREEKETVPQSDLHQLAENARVVWGFTGYVFMLTKAYTGMRLGEMYGLRREFVGPAWPECDPDRKRREKALKRYCGDDPMDVLRVQWQHKYVRDVERPEETGVPTLALPKYGSERTLVIPPFLAGLLAQLLDSHDSQWVFPAMGGGPLLRTDFHTFIWKPVRDGHKGREGRFARPPIPRVESFAGRRIHLMRHAHSPMLEGAGVAPVAVEERLGHIVQGVRGVYADVTPDMERHIVKVLQEKWEREEKRRGQRASGS
ncbi:integrase [Streptomyces sp. SGAir0957]